MPTLPSSSSPINSPGWWNIDSVVDYFKLFTRIRTVSLSGIFAGKNLNIITFTLRLLRYLAMIQCLEPEIHGKAYKEKWPSWPSQKREVPVTIYNPGFPSNVNIIIKKRLAWFVFTGVKKAPSSSGRGIWASLKKPRSPRYAYQDAARSRAAFSLFKWHTYLQDKQTDTMSQSYSESGYFFWLKQYWNLNEFSEIVILNYVHVGMIFSVFLVNNLFMFTRLYPDTLILLQKVDIFDKFF